MTSSESDAGPSVQTIFVLRSMEHIIRHGPDHETRKVVSDAMFNWLRRNKKEPAPYVPPPPPDSGPVARAMRDAETDGLTEPGKVMTQLVYDELTVRIDRDVIGMIRVTASQDNERRYSFSLRCPPADWEAALDEVFGFLASDRNLRSLPRTERIAGHYYGPTNA